MNNSNDIRESHTVMLRIMAVFITITASLMAGVAAWGRGGTTTEKSLLVALSIVICLGTHFLPALSKRKLTWFLWAGCLLAAAYSHLVFFSSASLHAGDLRAKSSARVVGTQHQIEAVHDALGEIKARPVSIVASELANTNEGRLRSALRSELAESKRAAILHDDLVRLTTAAATAEVVGAVDPVTSLLAAATGSSDASINLVIGLCFSILLELVGALLWFELLCRPGVVTPVITNQSAMREPVTALKDAVATGVCRPTVSGIRVFMGCSQAKALELRRTLN